jgi:hypothetical protein
VVAGDDGWVPLTRQVYFVDGNWHHFPSTRDRPEPFELRPNLVFVPRGAFLTLDGRRVLFLGGGNSVTGMHSRRAGINWWPMRKG